MRLSQLLSFLLIISTAAYAGAQTAPQWLDDDWRHSNFPADIYFCGYAEVSPDIDANPAAAAHTDALRLLAEAVFSNITVNTSSSIGSSLTGDRYEEFDNFSRDINVSSAVALSGIIVDSYVDKSSGTAYEFARVEKDRIRAYYAALLASDVAETESRLSLAEQAAPTSDRADIAVHADAIASLLDNARRHRRMLMAVDPSDDRADAIIAAETRLNALRDLVARGILIYINAAADESSALVSSKLKSALAANGCTFADTEDDADYLISLAASTELLSVYEDVFHVNASVELSLVNRRKSLIVYHDAVTNKGSALAEKQAAKKALANSASKIEKLIAEYLK